MPDTPAVAVVDLGSRAQIASRTLATASSAAKNTALLTAADLLVDDPSHETATAVMQLTQYVDVLIPRGGPSLIRSIRENATVPVIIDGDGNCHVYVDASADLDTALAIVVNAKTQRTSVCNAAESLLVHAAVADEFVPKVAAALVQRVGDPWNERVGNRRVHY